MAIGGVLGTAVAFLLAAGGSAPELRVQTGHAQQIYELAFDAQGARLATASADESVRLWDASSGAELLALDGGVGLGGVAFSADGKQLASCSMEGLRLYELSRPTAPRWSYRAPGRSCTSIAVQPFGGVVAAVFDDGTHEAGQVSLFAGGGGRLLRKLAIENVRQVQVSPDGKLLAAFARHASAGPDELALFELPGGKLLHSFSLTSEFGESISSRLAFSPDGHTVALGDRVLALPAGTVTGRLEGQGVLAFSGDGALLVHRLRVAPRTPEEQKLGTPLEVLDAHTLKPLRELPAGTGSAQAIAFRPGTHVVAVAVHGEKQARLLDADTGAPVQTLRGHANVIHDARFGDGPLLSLAVEGRPGFKLWRPRPGPRLQVLAAREDYDAGLSPSGKLLCSCEEQAAVLWDTASGAQVRSVPGKLGGACVFSSDEQLLALAPFSPSDGNTQLLQIARAGSAEVLGELGLQPHESLGTTGFNAANTRLVTTVRPYQKPDNARVYSVPGLAELKRFENANAALYRPDGRALVVERFDREPSAYVQEGLRLELLDAESFQPLAAAKNFHLRAFSPDGKLLVAAEEVPKAALRLHLLDAATLQSVAVLSGAPAGLHISFSPDGALLAITTEHQVELWSVQARKRVLSLIPLDDDDWVAVAPDGRFEGSPESFARLSWVQGGRSVPLEAFFDQFHSPGLFAQVLAAGALPARAANQSAPDLSRALRPAPLVRFLSPAPGQRFDSPEIEVEVEAADDGGGVQDLRLYQNDKLVGGESRGVRKKAAAPGKLVEKFSLALSPGANRLRAVASSSERTDSAPALLEVLLSAPQATAGLWLLVVGIDQYDNDRYRLTYAVKDAEAFRDAVRAHAAGIFGQVHEQVLLDKEATRAKIAAAFAGIQAAAQPGDALVFYYAGHGVMSEGGAKPSQFHLVPPDVTRLYGDDEQLAAKGISAEVLRTWTSAVRAQKQLLVLDACQSGGAVEQFAMRGAAEEKAILQLARSAGVVVLAATGTEQLATEFKELGHGVFTYALLEGLGGKADSGNPPDGKITVRELDSWLNDRVPELTQKYRGTRQYPSGFARGQDFPVGTAAR